MSSGKAERYMSTMPLDYVAPPPQPRLYPQPPYPQAPSPNPMPMAVQIGDQVLVFPPSLHYGWSPRCVAQIGTRGARCKARIDHRDDVDNYATEWVIPGTGGYIYPRQPAEFAEKCFVQQRCPKHIDADVPDVVAPTWELFSPDVHRDLIRYRPTSEWTPDGLRHVAPAAWVSGGGSAATKARDVGELLREAAATRVDPPCLTAVYRYYDADDLLLYVGMTGDLAAREWSHIKDSSWMEFAARSTISRYPTRREAELVEEAAIRAEGPLFNHRHNNSPEAALRLVEYLIKHGRTDLLAPAVSRG